MKRINYNMLNESLMKVETADSLKEFQDKVNDTLVQFIFTKLNGDVRMAFGTADPDWLDFFEAPEKPVMNGRVVQFFDVEANGWRCLTLKNGTKTNIAFCQTFKTPKKLTAAIDNEAERVQFIEDYMQMFSDNIDTEETPEEIADTVEDSKVVTAAPAQKERKERKPRTLNIKTLNKVKLVQKVITEIVKSKKGQSYINISSWDIFNELEDLLRKNNISIYDIWKNDDAFMSFFRTCYNVQISPYQLKLDKTIDYYGNAYIKGLIYSKKPCKEFDRLNKYLSTYLGVKTLAAGDIYREYVEGKRSTIFNRYGRKSLEYMPEKCVDIIKECRQVKKQNWKTKLDIKKELYTGDRYNSYGEDRECEWDGYEEFYLVISFYTPSGKNVKNLEFHV